MKHIAIIGAGPAGMTAAYQLSKLGQQVDIYEASDTVGGMARTIELWDCLVDIGPHRFFSSDREVNELWLEVAGKDYHMVNRLTRIFYKRRFFHYPLKPFNAFKNLGPFETLRCIGSYAQQRMSPVSDNGDFESWVTRRFGSRLFSIFFKTYSEKLWGVKCTELDADFAAQRIKKLSLYEAVKNAFFGGGGHKTLVDEFAYPAKGTGMIYQRMADAVKAKSGNLYLKTPVKKVIVEDKAAKGIELVDGTVKMYDAVISTMPLTTLVNTMDGTPENIKEAAGKLKFRNTIIVYLLVDGKNLFPDNWLYVHSPDLQVGRITNFRNWLPGLYGNSDKTILALELWCNFEDKEWSYSDEQLITLAKEDLAKTGLAKGHTVVDGFVYKIPRCYPIYSMGYAAHLTPVQEYLSGIKDLYPIGRYGAFKYNNQDHSILMGMLAAKAIMGDKTVNLWDINTDYESYQESTVITETGLQKK